ncbi:MAG: adenylate/guanylate cyclase domain-containing protein [Planctomycetaceae bacterium]
MAELVVCGPEPMQRWRRPIPLGEVIRVGRAPRSGWAIPWDALISREHAELQLVNAQLRVRRLGASRNPIYYQEADNADFLVNAGEQFRIGRTVFQLVAAELDEDAPSPSAERSFHPDELRKVAFQNADQRLEVLAKLPKAISQTTSDEDLASRVASLALEAIPTAEAASVVVFDDFSPNANPKMIRWDNRGESLGRFTPSRRLMLKALQLGQGLLHIWADRDESNPAFTVSGSLDWAFCMPFRGDACHGWCLYVSGQKDGLPGNSVGEEQLKGDLRFAELLSEFIGSIRQVRMLSKQQAGLSQFFSPQVLETLRCSNAEQQLEPKEADITVLFCDVRGFSKKSEQAQENLRELLNRVSDALGVMTCGIIKFDGVIADFQGDAALGFWGWPTTHDDDRLSACRAALQIQQEFQKARNTPGHSLSGFQVGIGVAHGRAIAGKIGTTEQIKVGAFGPTVNLGARLEGLTKMLGVSILLDEATAEYVQHHLPPAEGRLRRMGRFRPAGMNQEMTLTQLLPPLDQEPTVTNEMIALYESALKSFETGNWQAALDQFNRLPEQPQGKDFVSQYITQNRVQPPSPWNGVIIMQSK